METLTIEKDRAISEIQHCVEDVNEIIITMHINPDGDAISSSLLMASLMKRLGKHPRILIDDEIPKKFDYLPGVEEIEQYNPRKSYKQPDAFIVMDASGLNRIGAVRELIDDHALVINVDHHPSNDGFGTHQLVDASESSTVEVAFDLFSAWETPVTPEIATIVYTGIICDTGRFLFPNTTERSLSVATEMVRRGACPDLIAQKLYCRSSRNTVMALSSAMSTLEFYYDYGVACMHLSNNFLASYPDVDTEGFVDNLLAIEGTEVEFFMKEISPCVFKVSFRSKQYVDVNRLASAFGGGGHRRAAGSTIEGEAEEVKRRILEALKDHL